MQRHPVRPRVRTATGMPLSARAAVLIAVLAIPCMSPARADEYLKPIGGGGGSPFEARCASSEVLIGLELRVGDYIDAVRPLCATAYGARDVGAQSGSGWHGGSGGALTRIACPNEQPIANGMFVGTDITDTRIVNNVLMYCGVGDARRISVYARPGPPDSIAATYDDTQGCPVGQVAIGVHGRSGMLLDAIGLICDVPRLAVRSIGRVSTGTPASSGPPMSICERARNARARNSPAASNLEAQCLAGKTPVTSIGRVHAGAPPPPPDDVPPPATPASAPASRVSAGDDDRDSKHSARDAATQALIAGVISSINESRRGTAGARDDVERNQRRHDEYELGGRSTAQVDRDVGTEDLSQPQNSIRIEVRYPLAYGYKDAAGTSDANADSCGAFSIFAFPATKVRPRAPTRIETQAPMRSANDSYICEYLILDQPLDATVTVRVAMSDQRAAGSEAWLGGSEAQPPSGLRRTIVDGDRQIVLTANRRRASLRFEMLYAGGR